MADLKPEWFQKLGVIGPMVAAMMKGHLPKDAVVVGFKIADVPDEEVWLG